MRADPLLALCVGKRDLLGADRLHDPDKALASSATLNRIEVGTQRQSKYHKIHADLPALQETLLNLSVSFLPPDTHEVVLDFDNSDNPLHGEQLGDSFTAIMNITATCRCIASRITSCSGRNSCRRTKPPSTP